MEKITQETSQKPPRPKWLRRLERESWQAELIISGVAIFGSLQLPALVDQLADLGLVYFAPESYLGIYLFFIYLNISVYVLIFCLIAHFVFRAMWIGLIGLNSVFPEGIRAEEGYYSKPFMERLVKEFPNDNTMIHRLDNFCSVIFAFCAYCILVFIAINIDVLILFGIWQIAVLFLSAELADIVPLVLFAAFFLYVVLVLMMNAKKFKHTAFAERYHYPMVSWMGKVSFHMFYRPITRLSYTFMSNMNIKQYFGYTMSFFMIITFFSMFRMVNSNIIYFAQKDFLHKWYARDDRTLPENYENLRRTEHGRVLSATIESDRIQGNTMRVFVPVFNSEDAQMEGLCGEWTAPEGMEKDAARKLRRAFELECLKKYHRIIVNDSVYKVDIRKYYHENAGEYGILTYLPANGFENGLNLLKIEKLSDTDGIYREMKIPFWYFPDKQRSAE